MARPAMRGWRWPLLVAVLLICSPAGAGTAPVGGYDVKAALLYKIARFVRWPPSALGEADAPLAFCVVGDDPFGDAFGALVSRRVNKRPVVIRHYPSASAAMPGSCHLAFLSNRAGASPAAEAAVFAGQPVLTVSDAAGFVRAGGMLGIRTEAGRVRFEVSPRTAHDRGLQISSQLLQLATVVESGGAGR